MTKSAATKLARMLRASGARVRIVRRRRWRNGPYFYSVRRV
jgi:hypothetical protein